MLAALFPVVIGCSNSAESISKTWRIRSCYSVLYKDTAPLSAPSKPYLLLFVRLESVEWSINSRFTKPPTSPKLPPAIHVRECTYGGRGAVQGAAFSPSPVYITEGHVIRSVRGSWQSLDKLTGKPDCTFSPTKRTGFSPRAPTRRFNVLSCFFLPPLNRETKLEDGITKVISVSYLPLRLCCFSVELEWKWTSRTRFFPFISLSYCCCDSHESRAWCGALVGAQGLKHTENMDSRPVRELSPRCFRRNRISLTGQLFGVLWKSGCGCKWNKNALCAIL